MFKLSAVRLSYTCFVDFYFYVHMNKPLMSLVGRRAELSRLENLFFLDLFCLRNCLRFHCIFVIKKEPAFTL